MNEPHLSSSNRSMEYLLYSLDDVADIIRDKVYADENDKVGGVYDAAQKVIEYVTALAAQPVGAFGYAQRLAVILWEKHWKDDAPEWKPLPDIVGVLTQIDNMVAGLSRDLPQAPPDWEDLTAIIRPMIESVCSDGNSDSARLAKDIAARIIASCSLTQPKEK